MAIMVAISSEAQSSIQSLVSAYTIEKDTFTTPDDWMIAVYKYQYQQQASAARVCAAKLGSIGIIRMARECVRSWRA